MLDSYGRTLLYTTPSEKYMFSNEHVYPEECRLNRTKIVIVIIVIQIIIVTIILLLLLLLIIIIIVIILITIIL